MSDRLPPATGDAAIESALAAMRLRYVETSRGIIATFELIGEQLARAPDSDDLLIPLRRELHRVHGTAGSLGFHEAGRMAGAMEGLVRGWSQNPALDRERRSPIVSQFARALHEAITATVDAGVPRTRQLVLLGLPDPVADRLVAEAVHRGFAVERLDEATATSTSLIASPWGVVAMETSADLVATAGYGDAACVLLRDETAAVSFRRAAATNALDVATAPAEVLDLLDRVAGRRGVAGEVVLLIDDDPMMLLMLRALTEREGLSVETADSGVAFREALERVDPALVVLDVELPDADGIDLLREIRSDRRRRDMPVLILSGHSGADARAAAFGAGADDYMVKPVVPVEFQQRMSQLLELRRERRVSTGLHAVSGLPLPLRTMQELEARLVGRGDVEWSVGVLRPREAVLPAAETGEWQIECLRIARVVRDAGGTAGMMDEFGLALGLPLAPRDAAALLRSLAPTLTPGASTWHSGIVGADAIAAGTPRALLSVAADAYLAARDADVPARTWDPSDADIAPDVIVVEDDTALAEMLAFALNAKGLSHRTYSSGPEGLAALLRLRVYDRPPIVLLDIDLPGMDGHSLHERLRMERPGTFQVVFMSLHNSEADQLRALQGGALDYLPKPISLRILMAKLAVWRERTRVV